MSAVTHRPKMWTPVRTPWLAAAAENLARGSLTYEANRPANVGVEVTAGGVDVGLGLGA